MSEYGKGYIAKGALLDAVQWDNDIEKWVIWDDDLQSLMTEKNDVVEVVRCKVQGLRGFSPMGRPIETWRLHGLCLRRRESVHDGGN